MADDAEEEADIVFDRAQTFRLAKVAHGERNLMDNDQEIVLQAEAKQRREVCLPGVDAATAWAMKESSDRIRAKVMPSAAESGPVARIETGFVVFIHESWPEIHHLVRYFDLIEKNEAPDTSLLSWLVVSRAVRADVALRCIEIYTKKQPPLDPTDVEDLKMAAQVATELDVKEGKKVIT